MARSLAQVSLRELCAEASLGDRLKEIAAQPWLGVSQLLFFKNSHSC